MGKLTKRQLAVLIVTFAVIGVTGCSSNNSDQTKKHLNIFSLTKFAAPFRPIAGTLLETSNFPVYLPAYLPPPRDQKMEWLLKVDDLDASNNKFGIEISEGRPGAKGGGIYAGTLSGNIENHQGPRIVEQINNESKKVQTINLPNGIEGKEYIVDLDFERLITWKSGQWNFFVVARMDNKEDSARNYASEIIKTIGENGIALSGSPGKFCFLDIGANHPTTEIFWKVNDSIWYELDWRDNPSDAIKILRSMTYLGIGQTKYTAKSTGSSGSDLKQSFDSDKKAVASLVEDFGKKLQMVSLLVPRDVLNKSIQENYGNFISPELLAEWQQNLQNVPGRELSSPWPDRIEILSIKKLSEARYEIKGEIIELTSVEMVNGGVAAKRPITLMVEKIENRWLINAVSLGKYEG